MTDTSRAGTLALLVAAALAAGPALIAPPVARAAAKTFTVNSTADDDDGACQSLRAIPRGDCTLREAIAAANANAGHDTIAFGIRGDGVHTISPISPLPAISEGVTIDGYTQPGAQPNTLAAGTNAALKIELDGSAAGGGNGLTVDRGPTTMRGLVINRFPGSGIAMRNTAGNTNNVVAGNFLGTSPNGKVAEENGVDGVQCFGQCSSSRVGGPDPAHRNLASGNGRNGIFINSNDNTVEGNLVGTDKTGANDLGNGDTGIVVGGAGNTFTANVVAFNGGAGLSIAADGTDTGNAVRRNAIFANAGLGIDLDDDGRTGNDDGAPPDADTGANRLQNFPELDSAKTKDAGTTVKGTLRSTPNASFTVEFFANAPGEDEGRRFIGAKTVTTDGTGTAAFTFKPQQKVGKGKTITATATDEDGNTSEFSDPATVT